MTYMLLGNERKIDTKHFFPVLTALSGMQTRSSDENSVCLSVKRVHCDKTKKICPDSYYSKDHLAYFSEKKNDW